MSLFPNIGEAWNAKDLKPGDVIAIYGEKGVLYHLAIVENCIFTRTGNIYEINVIHRVPTHTGGGVERYMYTVPSTDAPKVYKVKDLGSYDRANAYKIAKSRVGERGYDVKEQNCEHFVYECCTGKYKSPQAENLPQKLVLKTGRGFGSSR